MARPGVNYQDIASAANELKGQGKSITIQNVRAILGTGSIGTINQHLRKWKEVQTASHHIATKENLPDSLIALMKGLWEGMMVQASEQFSSLEEKYQQEMAELKSELEKYKNNNQRWQKLFNQWQQEKMSLMNEKLTLEQAFEFAHKENASLGAKEESNRAQLQEKQERIDELNRLHQQTQHNLEHYREAAREQRLLDQQQFEREKQQLQMDIKNLNNQLLKEQTKSSEFQYRNQSLHQSYAELEKNHKSTLSDMELFKKKFEEAEKNNIEYFKACEHWQAQFKSLENKLESKITELITSQSNFKMLTQQLADTKQLLQEAKDQNKLLAGEKWEFAQEKAQLQGQIEQLQKMVSA